MLFILCFALPNILWVIERPICQDADAVTLSVQEAKFSSLVVENDKGRNSRSSAVLIPSIFHFRRQGCFGGDFLPLAASDGSNRNLFFDIELSRNSTEFFNVNIGPNSIVFFQSISCFS